MPSWEDCSDSDSFGVFLCNICSVNLIKVFHYCILLSKNKATRSATRRRSCRWGHSFLSWAWVLHHGNTFEVVLPAHRTMFCWPKHRPIAKADLGESQLECIWVNSIDTQDFTSGVLKMSKIKPFKLVNYESWPATPLVLWDKCARVNYEYLNSSRKDSSLRNRGRVSS